MLIRTRALIGLSAIALSGAALLVVWHVQREPERRFTAERQQMVDEAIRGSAGYQTATEIQGGYPSEITYYRGTEPIAVDIIDDRGKVVRRDLLDRGVVRVQLFYDLDGRLVATKSYDDGGRVRTTTPLLPVPPIPGRY